MWNNWQARLWARFFLLSVFATHTLTVHERADFYATVGLDAQEYDRKVIRKTNETAARAFPVTLNVEHPQFFQRLEHCADRNEELKAIESSNAPKIVKFLRKLPLIIGIFWDLLVLYLIKPIDAEALRGTVR